MHCVHVGSPEPEYVPASQLRQEVLPEDGCEKPAAQLEHVD